MSNTNYPRQLQQLGLNIARYRKLRGLTQEELAALISMSRTHLSNLEAPGKITSISLEKLFTIADVLNVSPASLLSFDSFSKFRHLYLFSPYILQVVLVFIITAASERYKYKLYDIGEGEVTNEKSHS